jgi:hypothetical protein
MEEIVKSMNFAAKISLLGKIAPPLKPVAPTPLHKPTSPNTLPKHQARGAVVAVEGDNHEAVRNLSKWLLSDLSESKDLHVKGIEGIEFPVAAEPPEDGEITPTHAPRQTRLSDYLKIISDWHVTSQDMTRFIQGIWTRAPNGTVDMWEPDGIQSSSVDNHSSLPQDTTATNTTAEPHITPVIIVPGYQLFASDVYAMRVPILDAYSPADHWQWMATLWRGTVGPDITIYVRDASAEELAQERFFEVREEMRCLVVRREKGGPAGRIEPAALRRVSFEIGEWVRSMNAKRGAGGAGDGREKQAG